ncbi:hypothetical protein [Clostridium thermobutyricum]|uniref:hypothetical protein n=1 Tax=Clostridium thermobutyricum TaxID=29372 RepID=UPI003F5252C1
MKCIWCGKRLDNDEIEKNIYYRELDMDESFHFCCENCKKDFIRYLNDVEKNKNKFLVGLFGLVFIYVVLNIVVSILKFEILSKGILIAFGCLFGILLIRFPYGTPETNKWIGIKNTIKVIRVMAIFIILASIIFGLIM